MTSPPDREPSVVAEPRAICPYLLVASGHWRNAEPSRDHVCTAEAEPIPLGLEIQRRLCFGDHEGCRRYEDALAAYRAAVPLIPLRPVARTAPVVIDRGRPPLPIPHLADRKGIGQVVLAVAMIAAVGALLVARLGPAGGGQSATPGASASATVVGSPTRGPTATPTATVTPTPASTSTPTPKPTAKPTTKPTATTGTMYTVRSGDTLSSIAAKFGTTVKALQKLNGISDPSLIHPGQILRIP